ncbi:MAG: DUF711 family protein [Patescibacteria group bacterium]|jgi:uncharacterized protein (UPF0210 family)
MLVGKGFEVQTLRICSNSIERPKEGWGEILTCIGVPSLEDAIKNRDKFFIEPDLSMNLDLTNSKISLSEVDYLFEIIRTDAKKTFNFAYVFNNQPSSPYFPSATYSKEGFSIGLQTTDLSDGCKTLEEWFDKLRLVWMEIDELFKNDKGYLGIDSSIAPVFQGQSSLVNLIKRLGPTFKESVLSDIYLRTTKFIKENNPKPIGLCGLMFPCLEDFELAEEYEKGEFTLERNLFLSLHSGLGVDTYPIGIDEDPKKILDILKTVQGLSNKYKKPLSVRFVSDGKAKIGEKTDFKNQYLKDVIIRAIK